MSMDVALSRVHFPVSTLGPGRRLGIWFQGCSIRCPGCISADTWAFSRSGGCSVAELLRFVAPWLHECDGITVSGGEPFDQPQALLALLEGLAPSGKDVLVFSGYPIERLAAWLVQAEGRIDALVSDPFEAGTPQTRALRGSDNQRLHLLTARGRERFAAYDRPLGPGDRQLDVMFDGDGTAWLAGIPRPGDVSRLRAVLAAQGHRAATTEASGPHR